MSNSAFLDAFSPGAGFKGSSSWEKKVATSEVVSSAGSACGIRGGVSISTASLRRPHFGQNFVLSGIWVEQFLQIIGQITPFARPGIVQSENNFSTSGFLP
jgi:hypothetical protein